MSPTKNNTYIFTYGWTVGQAFSPTTAKNYSRRSIPTYMCVHTYYIKGGFRHQGKHIMHMFTSSQKNAKFVNIPKNK